jgi:serine/threonine-protein kinase
MGRVYEARHLRIGGKRFAIKALHEEFIRNKEVLARFQREAEAASSIASEHVVEVYDVLRTEDGRPFMVAEMLVGKELGDYLLEVGRMTVDESMPIIQQICAGLSAAHAKGIIHRDMKPENIFLVGDLKNAKVKILDFGISKSGDAPGTQLTKTGVIMGTPSFMSPEQAKGDKVTHVADVYAAGAILYTMLTGRRPFDKNEPTATLLAVLVEEAPRPRSLDPSIPEALESVIQKAMAKAPEDRYQSIDELTRDLTPFFNRESNPAGAVGAKRPTRTVSDEEMTALRSKLTKASPLALAFTIGALALTLTGIMRLSHGATAKSTLSGGQMAFAIALPIVLIGTAVVFIAAYVRGMPNEEVKRSDLVSSVLTISSAVGLVTLGFGFLFVRFIETLLLHRAVGAAWPMWEVMLPILAITGAGLAALFTLKGRDP